MRRTEEEFIVYDCNFKSSSEKHNIVKCLLEENFVPQFMNVNSIYPKFEPGIHILIGTNN